MAKACTADTDCGTGLVCLKATDKLIGNQGGPSNGYCTMKCVTQADATTCAAAGGLCLDLSAAGDGSVGYCLQNCTIGAVAATDPPKCQGRSDLGCAQVYDSTGAASGAVCLPVCAQDSDCPTGRKCDPADGYCVDTAHTGDPMGAHCTADPSTGASTCAGYCQGFVDANDKVIVSFCTQHCVIGELGCNIAGPNTSVAGGTHGVCAFASDAAADLGDIGICTVECDTVNDCPDKTDPNPVCDATDTMSVLGHGICTWN
jgi:Cys-rich repeat protein